MTVLTSPSFSPFESVFSGNADKIPFVFREQFLHSPDYSYNVVLDGRLNVWHRPKWLYPLFWFLENLGILVSESGNDIAMTLMVRAVREFDKPVHYWDRAFQFAKERQFNTILAYDPTNDKVVDFVGKNGFVYIVWEARFQPPLQFTLDTLRCAFRFNGTILWLPKWFWEFCFGKVHCVVTADNLTDNKYGINLSIWHPWFGNVFGYGGRFKSVRQEKVN